MAQHEYEIKKELKRLSSVRGQGTELISLYIPPDSQISDAVGKLKEEYGQAGNIKSKSTRLNVQAAIDKIIQYLRLYKKPPKNGLAIFSGNISSIQANPRVEMFSIEPLAPININMYRCDSTFVLEPLETMLESKEIYILLVMDGKDATIGMLKGTYFEFVTRVHSFAHAKVRKGGQSAARYERMIEESIDYYFKSVGNALSELYLKYGRKVSGLIIGGPGPIKESFIKAKTMNYQIKVLGVFDTGYTDEHMGVNELLSKSKELLAQQAVTKERQVMERFLQEVANNGLAVFGYLNVKAALDLDNVARLIISEDAELSEVVYECNNCKQKITSIEEGNSRKQRHECAGNLTIISEKDVIEPLIEAADSKNIEISFISAESQYGKELILGFHGIAAMLRYKR